MTFMAGKPDKRPFIQVLLLGTFKATYGLYLKLKWNVTMVKNQAYRTQGPYILLANHIHNFDPVFIQHFWPRIICYVTNDTVWKLKWLRGLLDSIGFIPKKKMTTDSSTVRGILMQIKNGRIIGIFPEGKRSWGGKTLPIIPSTANLIKKLKLPVVTVKIEGAMASQPRWAKGARRGKIFLNPETTLTASQVADMSVEDIMQTISNALDHDETAFLQANPKLKYHSKRPAEYLELYLYACKDCGALKKMYSDKDTFTCKACGSTYDLTRDMQLKHQTTKEIVTLSDWEEQQIEITKNAMIKAVESGETLFLDEEVTLYEYIRLEPLKQLGVGSLRMTAQGMVFESENSNIREYPVKQITNINIQRNSQLEFTIEDRTFRFFFKPRVSPYKWQTALGIGKTL
ncbi:MAG: 1-acyl-sn-glycerol-3-phosphate acyltransferase [Eubacteriales bacterium]